MENKEKIQELNDAIFILEKAVKGLEKRLNDLSEKMLATSVRNIGKSNYVKIPKKVGKEGDIVGVFKIKDEDFF